ncbi:Phage tail fiber protein [Candidatus Hepatincola sp. Av]
MSFEIVYTDKGLEKLVLAENGTPLVLEKFAVGDGENTPETSQTTLQNEKWRGYINKVEPSSTTPTNLLITCVIPAQIPITEAFYIRELGLFDTEEELIAIAKVPDSYYAQSSNGIASEKLYNIVLSISNTAEVTLELDTTILATQESVKELEDTVEELTDQFQNALTQLNNKFIKTLKTQIGKIIINMDNSKRDLRHWDDGVFEYILCDGGPINTEKHPELIDIYGTNVPNFKDGTVRNLITGSSRALGSWEEDALQEHSHGLDNITGNFSCLTWASDTFRGDGAFSAEDIGHYNGSYYQDSHHFTMLKTRFSSQGSPGVQNATLNIVDTQISDSETRMKNIAVQFYVIAKVLI